MLFSGGIGGLFRLNKWFPYCFGNILSPFNLNGIINSVFEESH